jgi:hypothetical protein
MADSDESDLWQMQHRKLVQDFAEAVSLMHESNPWPEFPLLPNAMDYLMTEFWDRCFSQTEIREAFELALRNLPRYAAGEEVRGDAAS